MTRAGKWALGGVRKAAPEPSSQDPESGNRAPLKIKNHTFLRVQTPCVSGFGWQAGPCNCQSAYASSRSFQLVRRHKQDYISFCKVIVTR
jgi:hypothetical protein